MTFRSLATLLGGVPADTSDTPGEPVGTRFVGFGEALTSAIANRPHYALAENTDDLNARVAIFETGGLDAAYDLGLAAVSGGGRIVTKDGGAIETQSALATQYADDIANAHFRANMSGDAISGSIGFDAVGGASLQQVGLHDRAPADLNDDTIIAGAGSACTLNPAGAGVDQIRLDGGARFRNAGDTNLGLTFEMVEVTGAGAQNGLYLLGTFVSDTIATFVRLDGTAPAFPADTGGTLTLQRRRFSSSQAGFGSFLGSLFMGEPGDTAAAIFIPGTHSDADPTGADNAWIAALQEQSSGNIYSSLLVDRYGRLESLLNNDFMPTEELQQFGYYGMRSDRSQSVANYNSGFIYDSGDSAHEYAFQANILAGDASVGYGITFNFTATPDEIDVVGAASGAALQSRTAIGLTFCRVLTPTAQAGWYYVSDKVGLGTTVLQLRNLDGTAPSFPGAGSGTIGFLSGVSAGVRQLANMSGTLGLVFNSDPRPAMTINGHRNTGSDSGGLIINVPFYTNADPLRCYRSTQDTDQILFGVTSQGFIYGFSDFRTDGEYEYNVNRAKTLSVDLFSGWQDGNVVTEGWVAISFAPNSGDLIPRLNANRNFASIFFPITSLLPEDSVLTRVRLIVQPGTNRATVGDRMQVDLFRTENDWDNSNSYFPDVGDIIFATNDDGNIGNQLIDSGAISETIDNSDEHEWFLRVLAGNNAATFNDDILAIQLDYTDEGPRNLGV